MGTFDRIVNLKGQLNEELNDYKMENQKKNIMGGVVYKRFVQVLLKTLNVQFVYSYRQMIRFFTKIK